MASDLLGPPKGASVELKKMIEIFEHAEMLSTMHPHLTVTVRFNGEHWETESRIIVAGSMTSASRNLKDRTSAGLKDELTRQAFDVIFRHARNNYQPNRIAR